MSGSINALNITSENIKVTNLTVTNINGRPYTGSGGCGSYYTSCPSCDGQPSEEPCLDRAIALLRAEVAVMAQQDHKAQRVLQELREI
jgi:hypothetical protein